MNAENKLAGPSAGLKPKVLLIGATGKLGSSVLDQLLKEKHKYEVRLLVRKPLLDLGCQNFIADILKDDLTLPFSWADVVVNCSGLVSYLKNDKRRLHKLNVEGIKSIISACNKFKKPLIHSSSAIAYGSSSNPVIFKEGDSLEQVYKGEYAKSKFLADQIVQASEIPYIIFRPGTLISTLTKLYKFYKKGFVAELKGGASFALRDEVAKAYVSGIDLLLTREVHAIFNLGGNNLTFIDVFASFKKLDYRQTKVIRNNVLNALSIANDCFLNPLFKKNILTRDNFITGNHFTFIDSTKAQQELNYKIPPFNLSLKEVVDNDIKRRSNS
ncbi:NAD-dependent epimerase/dehydratase family protein [Desertivirga xinjiangensis]|uniref:NAD-dependent epimerase/dehydratase family protein n=1 Tax=Desertivirga xinjiangensis TaxID=539206 RepID=UPI00210B9A13|nr:SDR family oxidoreductase [Pedobacter xinjiangensis]